MHSRYIFKFTVTAPFTVEPSGTTQEMVNVVAAVIGCVAAPPESEFWLKPPLADVSVQLTTPCVFQKIEVRPPSATDAGTAQMSTLGVPVTTTAGVVVAAGAGFGFVVC